ncbi:MAG TPA: hypothetical protein VHX38_37710 [Pseudonocardiaceae bacterium]|nr:hypothetical protein [Pseudonocardiaceae bacterium]
MDTMPEREQTSAWPTTAVRADVLGADVLSADFLAAEIPHPQTSFEIWGNSARCVDDQESVDRHILRGID